MQVDKGLSGLKSGLECLAEVHELRLSKHFLDGDKLRSELSSLALRALHGPLKDASRVSQFEFEDGWQDIGICKEWLLLLLVGLIVLNLCENTRLWLVVNPFTDEELILVMVEVGALALAEIIDPVALKVVPVSLGEHSVAVALALVPLTLVDVLVGVDHAALPLGHTRNPVAVIAVSVLVEEGPTTVLLVFKPIARVLSPQLARFIAPVSALPVPLVSLPETLILVTVLVELDAEAVFLVVLPVANVARRVLPLLAFNASVLLSLLLLHPVDRTMSSILLRFIVAPGYKNYN
jgi:hypothetical protein